MPGRYRFTGNPQVAMYEPRGLEYFSYLPQLKAKVRGAALARANELQFDLTGLAPQDLKTAQDMTQYVTQARDGIVDNLLDGEDVTNSIATNLFKLSQTKKDKDQKLSHAMNNAKLRQQFIQSNQAAARQSQKYEYFNRVNEVADQQFQGSFDEEGNNVEYAPQIDAGYYDLKADLEKRLQTAMPEMTEPGELASYMDSNFQVLPVDLGNGQVKYQVVYDKPTDKWSNETAIDRAVDGFNNMLADENSDGGKFVNFMGPDYMHQFSNQYVQGIRDNYIRTSLEDGRQGMISGPVGGSPNGTDSGGENPFTFNYELNDHGKDVIIKNDTQVDVNSTPGDYDVKAAYSLGKGADGALDSTTGKINIIGEEDYQTDVATKTAFLFGTPTLTVDDLLTFANTKAKNGINFNAQDINMGEDRFAQNQFATAYRDALKTGNGTARDLHTQIGELDKMMTAAEESSQGQVQRTDAMYLFSDGVASDYQEGLLKERRSDYNRYKNAKHQSSRDFAFRQEVVDYNLSDLDKTKANIMRLSSQLYNDLVANNTDSAFKLYDYSVDTLFPVIKSDQSGDLIDLHDKVLRPRIDKSLEEGAQSMIFTVDPETNQLKTLTGSTDDSKAGAKVLAQRAVRGTEMMEGFEGKNTNKGHPTILATNISSMMNATDFTGTPDEIEMKKAEMDARYAGAIMYSVTDEKYGERLVIIENKVPELQDAKTGPIGIIETSEGASREPIKNVINSLPKAGSKVVHLNQPEEGKPALSVRYFYGDGGQINMYKYRDGQRVGKIIRYHSKNQASAMLPGFIKKFTEANQ